MWKHRFNSFRYAFNGILELFRAEPNARIHLVFTILVIIMGWYLEISRIEWCVVILCIASVLAAEAFNTALENLTDLVSPGQNSLAGKTKDVAAGAVLICAIGAAIAGLIIFLPKIWRLI